jgi:hypothetical protein
MNNIKNRIKAFIFLTSFICISCASQPNPEAAAKSGKMTPAKGGDRQYRLGIKVKIEGLGLSETTGLVKNFEDQLSVFEPCFAAEIDQGQVLRLDATFTVSKKGLLKDVKIREMQPEIFLFRKCFLKQIQQLDMGRQETEVKGSLSLGSYYGPAGDFSDDIKKLE